MKKVVNSISNIFKPKKEDSPSSKARNELLIDIPCPKKVKSPESVKPDSAPVDYGKIVTLSLDSRFTAIKSAAESQVLPFMVTYKAKDEKIESSRVGLDLVMIIDVSGSMSGEKIQLVRETLVFIIDEMQDTDRLCLVKFDDVSRILTNLTPMTPEFKSQFKGIVQREIRDCGSTNINLGLKDGFDVLLHRKQVNDVSAMFLLSDGQDTCGNTLKTFESTLQEYDEKMKKKHMEYKINSFGYGNGHDEKVLAAISNYKNGNFYYIKDLKLVDECFIECVGMLMSIFATKAEITVFLDESAKFVKRYGRNWDSQNSLAKGTLSIGGLAVGVEKNFMAEIQMPPLKDRVGSVRVAHAILSFETKERSYNIPAELFLEIRAGDDLGAVNIKVEENLLRVQAAETMAEAEEDYKKGDVQLAQTKLSSYKARAKANAYISKEYEEKIQRMVCEDNVVDAKNMKQVTEVLSKQAYAPGYVNLTSMNHVQTAMKAKRSS